jgi:hypothetical protein
MLWSRVLNDTHNQLVSTSWNNNLIASFAVNNLHVDVVVDGLRDAEDDFVGVNFLAECQVFF